MVALPLTGFIDLIKALENVGQFIRRNTDPGIFDAQFDSLIDLRSAQMDRSTIGGKAQRVANQISDNLRHARKVNLKRGKVGRGDHGQLNMTLIRDVLKRCLNLTKQIDWLDRFKM